MSLYVLDTDIATLYRRGHEAVMRHVLTHTPEELAITAIALASGATLVTRNVQDFQRIPGLVIEDWTA